MDLNPIITNTFDLIKTLVPQKTGTKFLVTLGGMFAILYMAFKEIGTDLHIYAVCLIIVLYYIADIFSKRKEGDA